ncbi:MAG: GGDEF domain-containing protein [Betaproteobacteria bacterium]|nr:GGDEF domain-containing protein [Betaproteobacteria bacterium]
MELDSRMVLSVAFSALLMAVVFHFQARSFPITVKGLQRWSHAYWVFAAAAFLQAGRQYLPDFFSILVGTVLLQAGVLLLYVGLCQFKNKEPKYLLWAAPASIHLLGSLWFIYIDPLLWARVTVTTFTNASLLLLCLVLILTPDEGKSRWRFSSMFAAIFISGVMAIAMTRGVWALWYKPVSALPIAPTSLSVLTLLYPITMVAFSMGLVLIAFDRLKQELEYLISHDVLTGAYSRRGFIQLAEAEVSRAHRMQRDVALLMLDLDRFKMINDHYGHPTGDEVLQKFVEVSKECLRREDLLGRYGGEEFMILLPDTSPVAARVVAERIRVAVSVTRLTVGSRNIRFTVSVGIASVSDGVSLDQLLKSADGAVYLAKSRGRNRVEVAA